jgi:hypothetical protein
MKTFQAKRKFWVNINAMYSDAYLEYFGIIGKRHKLFKVILQDIFKQIFFQPKLFIFYFFFRYEFKIELESINSSRIKLSFKESSDIWYSRTTQLSGFYGSEIGFLNDINKFRTKNLNRVYILSVEKTERNNLKKLEDRIFESIDTNAFPEEAKIIDIPRGSSRIVHIKNGIITSQHFAATDKNIFPTSNINILTKAGWPTDLLLSRDRIVSSMKYDTEFEYEMGLISKFSGSWYHFLIDTLPVLLKYRSKIKKVPYLCFGDIPFQIKESLIAVTGIEPISMPPCATIKINSLLLLQDYRFDNLYDFVQRKEDIDSVRNFYSTEVNFRSDNPPSRRIFLAREAELFRKLNNSQEVHQFLSTWGFEIVYPNRLSLKEQLELYSQTKILISETGAALVNSLFLPKNSSVIELKYGHIIDHIWPNFLAQSALNYVQCQMRVNKFSRKAHADFKKLSTILENFAE